MKGLSRLSKQLETVSFGEKTHDKSVSPTKFDISKIHEDEANARKEFDIEALTDLSNSIKAHGVISPISIRPHESLDGEFVINYGHRRFRASKMAGLTQIPAFLDTGINVFGRFIENIQREDLSILDIASQLKAFTLIKDKGLTLNNRDIANRIGKSETWISRHLALLDLPPNIKEVVQQQKIKSSEAALQLASLAKEHSEEVDDFIQQNEGEISQRKIREFAKEIKLAETQSNAVADENASEDTVPETAVVAAESATSQEQEQEQTAYKLSVPKLSIADSVEKQKSKEAANTNLAKQDERISYFIELLDAILLTESQKQMLKAKLDSSQLDSSFDALRDYIDSEQG